MHSTVLRELPVDRDVSGPRHDTRLVELVMALSGCPARRALELVRMEPATSPLSRVAYALTVMRADVQASTAS